MHRDSECLVAISLKSPTSSLIHQQGSCGHTSPLYVTHIIGAKPNLYCEAIELVCVGSPKVGVLVEWKALDRVKSEL